jgi:malonyl-CoA/methylmalonyl-CoA synthetase
MNLFDLSLVGRAAVEALEWEGRTFTFGEIEERSNRVAHALQARGFVKGDRLCVYLGNRIELVDLFLAYVKLGVIFVPINILYREREIAHIVRDAEPRELLDRPVEGIGPAVRPAVLLNGDDPAAIIYTSGTTGTSKGAVLTHNNFAANAVNLITAWQISERDRFLLSLPLFHIHALGNGLHCWLISGCRMRLLERFDHTKAEREFLDFRPTLFFGVPAMYVRLLELPPAIATTMRLFVSGSAPLPADVFERFRAKFGHTILERYGMTETFMNLSNPYIGERRAGTVGFPLPGVSVRIDEGELLVRGPNVFAGYWRRPDATRDAFTADGYFRTGDLAAISEDGYYTLLGRKSDLIISGGYNIYPREIEELLLEQEGVQEAAVVGIPDRVRGEVPVACVVGERRNRARAGLPRTTGFIQGPEKVHPRGFDPADGPREGPEASSDRLHHELGEILSRLEQVGQVVRLVAACARFFACRADRARRCARVAPGFGAPAADAHGAIALDADELRQQLRDGGDRPLLFLRLQVRQLALNEHLGGGDHRAGVDGLDHAGSLQPRGPRATMIGVCTSGYRSSSCSQPSSSRRSPGRKKSGASMRSSTGPGKSGFARIRCSPPMSDGTSTTTG